MDVAPVPPVTSGILAGAGSGPPVDKALAGMRGPPRNPMFPTPQGPPMQPPEPMQGPPMQSPQAAANPALQPTQSTALDELLRRLFAGGRGKGSAPTSMSDLSGD
jgi:hypothetical protein